MSYYFALAPNHLRSKENHFTILDIAVGCNSKGEKLINGDLIFEVDEPPHGLNDRATSKTVVIPRDQIVNSEKSA